MSLYQLQPSTIKLITSAQVITSVSTAVKELVENALDAASSVIEVRLVSKIQLITSTARNMS